jgi:hypothetical protein
MKELCALTITQETWEQYQKVNGAEALICSNIPLYNCLITHCDEGAWWIIK